MIRNVFKKIRDQYKFFVCRKGIIELTSGEYELFIHTKIKGHENVDLDVQECDDYHTCSYLPNNIFEIEKHHDGFKLIAKIESSEVKVFWSVK